ncbi:MAG TPA: hypothetical protein QGF58_07475 [Myxococcota bacterium]|nr:hypothetical protein [Myxococcota bacterium]
MFSLLLACAPGPGGDVAWAVNYATVTPEPFGVTGHHVWAFFAEGWDDKREPAYHVCTLLQSIEGSEVDAYDDCVGCIAMYEVVLEDIEHDCDAGLVSDASYRGLEAIGVGDVGEELADDDPHPGDSLGWSLSYDGQNAEAHGWAFAEGHGWGGEVEDGWVDDAVYTLWPGYAWDLR